MKLVYLFFLSVIILTSCIKKKDAIVPNGQTLHDRFPVPDGFTEDKAPLKSYAKYLKEYPLKLHTHKARYWNGRENTNYAYAAVLDLKIFAGRDLEQCADVIMHVKSDYHKSRKEYTSLTFSTFGNQKVVYKGNYQKFLLEAFDRCNTQSLNQDLVQVTDAIKAGDVFNRWKRGKTGHILLVLRVARDSDGNEIFQLAQGGTPAHEMQVIYNERLFSSFNYWFTLDGLPQRFKAKNLYRFKQTKRRPEIATKSIKRGLN
ncbi:hypothetical protein TH63_13455 [Rufibacter radiotolerans]|uniref:Lipoprotein n=1 Tax=Rufibacter radiotolerans TaxID=1379910 RepID=A0A0H4W7I3_9BACT|nr:DUF4846 domain-containing protein [Rufibacter radiotolerans]AKQ46401.1 hypothetical protein TH63_13455 [Rufibacter radiotolerans]